MVFADAVQAHLDLRVPGEKENSFENPASLSLHLSILAASIPAQLAAMSKSGRLVWVDEIATFGGSFPGTALCKFRLLFFAVLLLEDRTYCCASRKSRTLSSASPGRQEFRHR
jgi:hypothetical protein